MSYGHQIWWTWSFVNPQYVGGGFGTTRRVKGQPEVNLYMKGLWLPNLERIILCHPTIHWRWFWSDPDSSRGQFSLEWATATKFDGNDLLPTRNTSVRVSKQVAGSKVNQRSICLGMAYGYQIWRAWFSANPLPRVSMRPDGWKVI